MGQRSVPKRFPPAPLLILIDSLMVSSEHVKLDAKDESVKQRLSLLLSLSISDSKSEGQPRSTFHTSRNTSEALPDTMARVSPSWQVARIREGLGVVVHLRRLPGLNRAATLRLPARHHYLRPLQRICC